jgi:ribonuclease P protein component
VSVARPSEKFPAWRRIKLRRDFLRLQAMGGKHHTRFFLVFCGTRTETASGEASRSTLPSRLGITVTRKVGKAHQRNLIKRRLREAFRRQRHTLPEGLDMVFIAKRTAVSACYADVVRDVAQLQRKVVNSLRSSARAQPSDLEHGTSSGERRGEP